jgi:hypothetical protein
MFGNLHDQYDGFRMPSHSGFPRSVQSLGTTARQSESLANPTTAATSAALVTLGASAEWLADLEYVWRSRVAGPIGNLNERARRRRRQAAACPAFGAGGLRVMALRSAEWAEDRARALAMARADVISTCGKRWRVVRCGCRVVEMQVGCEQPQLCAKCRRLHWQKWRKRITLAMDTALRAERRDYFATPGHRRRGMKPGIYLITLTAPHSGDLETDRRKMGEAVRKLFKEATRRGWWRTYALTWEVTSGEDGRGHLHAHLAVISSWIPYTGAQAGYIGRGDVPYEALRAKKEPALGESSPAWNGRRAARGLHDVWRDAMPGALVLDVQPPRTGADEAAIGAHYLAKYVTKGVDPSEMTGRKAGEMLIAFRSRRKVTTSAGFWNRLITTCEECAQAWRSMGAPVSLQQLAPGAVLRAMSERSRHRRGDCVAAGVPRGRLQVGLRWDGG